MTAGTLLVGCGLPGVLGGDEDDEKAISVGTTDVVTSLDPAGAYDAGSWALYGSVYQSLLAFPPGSSRPEPDAAERCDFEDTKLMTYTCTMKEGLTFSNGDEVTATDVQFSFRRIFTIKADRGPAPLLSTIKSVTSSGDTVTFRLKTPDATLPFKIASGAGAIVDSGSYPSDGLREDGQVVGSGPYKLSDFTKGESARLRPRSGYEGAYKIRNAGVDVRYFKNSEALGKAWEQGDLEVASRELPAKTYAALEQDRDPDSTVRVFETRGAEVRHAVFNLRKGSPVRKREVRRAAALLVDRETLARDAREGAVEPLYSLIPRGILGHTTAFFDASEGPDPAAAKKLLRDAGVRTPVRITVGVEADSGHDLEADLLKRQLESDGLFSVTIKKQPWDAFVDSFVGGEFDLFTISWMPDFPDAETYVTPIVGAGNTYHNGYRSGRVEELIKETQRLSDRPRTVGGYEALDQEIVRDVPVLPLWQGTHHTVAEDQILGIENLQDSSGAWRVWELGRS